MRATDRGPLRFQVAFGLCQEAGISRSLYSGLLEILRMPESSQAPIMSLDIEASDNCPTPSPLYAEEVFSQSSLARKSLLPVYRPQGYVKTSISLIRLLFLQPSSARTSTIKCTSPLANSMIILRNCGTLMLHGAHPFARPLVNLLTTQMASPFSLRTSSSLVATTTSAHAAALSQATLPPSNDSMSALSTALAVTFDQASRRS